MNFFQIYKKSCLIASLRFNLILKLKFIYQELPEGGAFMTAQLAGNEVVYSVVLARAGNPLSREDVESHFKAELSKK